MLQTSKVFIISIILFPLIVVGQVSSFEKAETFFYNKDFKQATLFYKNVISNDFSLKKEIAIAKCRVALINNSNANIDFNLKYLEESLVEDILPSAMNSICSYALLQLYYMKSDYKNGLNLIKKIGIPNLQPIYLAKFLAISAEISRISLNKEQEINFLKQLLALMKKNNFIEVNMLNTSNKRIKVEDIESRLSVLNFDKNIDNEFQANFIENVLLAKIKEGDLQLALNILEKNIISNRDSLLLNFGINLSNDKIRTRIIKLISDDPLEMRIGIILPINKNRQESNQNILRSISSFLASPAVNGVKYNIIPIESNLDEGSLSEAAEKLIFRDLVHSIIVPESFKDKNDLNYLANIFSIPVIYTGKNLSFSSSNNSSFNSIKYISKNGKFRDYFEDLIKPKDNDYNEEEKIFDALIILRNIHYLANSSQNFELDKVIHSGHWKVEGISSYEGKVN
ncbi:hypothetical protein QEJ31_06350 [Pigmentibacter sp. JX0631]|uniref:hypothetical protein n=1 Tax=Pigmentibacter sp. JX0631 TaxID=2976982 RepID=UPI0024696BDE|nr:hypothetical protein [Pigmentibacter sp. JX0631]WGL61211.1 hypothetical protein QEJ31_06350 [Pigmentibacter sp. JX0631]